MNGPRVVCAACGEVEIGIFSPICDECAGVVFAGIPSPKTPEPIVPDGEDLGGFPISEDED